jgi:hypothetical protein
VTRISQFSRALNTTTRLNYSYGMGSFTSLFGSVARIFLQQTIEGNPRHRRLAPERCRLAYGMLGAKTALAYILIKDRARGPSFTSISLTFSSMTNTTWPESFNAVTRRPPQLNDCPFVCPELVVFLALSKEEDRSWSLRSSLYI